MNLSPQAQASASATVLEVRDLRTIFRFRGGTVCAVNGVSFSVAAGELLGVVGESGSGKSVTMMSLMRLLPMPPAEIVSGSVRLGGRELLSVDPNEMRDVRGGEVGFIFQDTMTALNPVFAVGYQIMEPLRAHLGLGRWAASVRAVELMALVGNPSQGERIDDYPHQFSGGMRQRVMIAIALSCDPKVDRRRADDGARRDHLGADRRAGKVAAARVGHGHHLDHARSRRGRRHRRPRAGHVWRAGRRACAGR